MRYQIRLKQNKFEKDIYAVSRVIKQALSYGVTNETQLMKPNLHVRLPAKDFYVI